MNPCSADQDGAEDYAGSEALDPALADRFALFVRASDWGELTPAERRKIAAPAGEGRIAGDGGRLRAQIEAWRARFVTEVETCPEQILLYVTTAVTALNGAGIRISPRRSRLMTRSLLAASIAAGKPADGLFRRVLDASLPHPCWGITPAPAALAAAHRAAWDVANATAKRWLHDFMAESRLAHKLGILLDDCDSSDAGSQAVAQLLATEPPERAAAFAFSVYPAAALRRLPIGAEGVNDLGKLASSMLSVKGEITWAERLGDKNTQHPEIARYARVLAPLKGGRLERASQLFNAFLVKKIVPPDPAAIEAEVDACVALLKEKGLA
jgi:MoxR-like ATPase